MSTAMLRLRGSTGEAALTANRHVFADRARGTGGGTKAQRLDGGLSSAVNGYHGPAFRGGEGGPGRRTLRAADTTDAAPVCRHDRTACRERTEKVRSSMSHSVASATMPRARNRSREVLLQLLAPDSRPRLQPYGHTAVAGRSRLRRLLSGELLELRSLR